jgi:hypothetical protein
MGVSLSLEGPRQARVRRRGGQHTRTAEEQACLDAFAAFLHGDALSAARFLSRVSESDLATRLLPASRALARAVELVLASDQLAISNATSDFVKSPVCLLGRCGGPPSTNPCQSLSCQCRCHLEPAALPAEALHNAALAGPVVAGTVVDSAGDHSAGDHSAGLSATPRPERGRLRSVGRGQAAPGRTRRRAS